MTFRSRKPSRHLPWLAIASLAFLVACPNVNDPEVQTFTVTYYANQADGGTVPEDSKEYRTGESVTIAANSGNLVRTGHAFLGWNSRPDGTGTLYFPDTPITIQKTNIELYAFWAEIPALGILVEPFSARLTVGETLQLVATVQPANAIPPAITWESNNTSIATVTSEGLVRAIAPGNATITASTADGTHRDTCLVTVIVSLLSLTLDTDQVVLAVNQGLQLNEEPDPSDAAMSQLSWTSSNSEIATVDGAGYVRAIAPGNATITASTADALHSATCEVTVVIPVDSITLSSPSVFLYSNETHQLEATIDPENATNPEVVWLLADEDVATIGEDGLLTPTGPGQTTIRALAADGFGAASVLCNLTVATYVPVTSLSLDITELDLSRLYSHQLTATVEPEDASKPQITWSSDDTGILEVDDSGIVRGVAEGSAVVRAEAEAGELVAVCVVTVSPLDRIVISMQAGDTTDVFSFRPDGTDLVNLTTGSGSYTSWPRWAPDGSAIYFSSDQEPAGLYRMDPDGSNQTLVREGFVQYTNISPFGTMIAFAGSIEGSSGYYCMNNDGSNLVKLSDLASNESSLAILWSPDGTLIAFQSKKSGNNEVYTIQPDGSNETNHTNSSANDLLTSWHYMSGHIGFCSDRYDNGGTNYEACIVNVSTGGIDRITYDTSTTRGPYYSALSPNYLIVQGGASIYGTSGLITSGGNDVIWSPDGSRILYQRTYDYSWAVIGIDGNGYAPLGFVGQSPDWFQDPTTTD